MAEPSEAPATAQPAAPAATPAPAAAFAPHPTDAAIEAWLTEHVRNSPISRATEAWNHLTAVLPHLAAKLKEH